MRLSAPMTLALGGRRRTLAPGQLVLSRADYLYRAPTAPTAGQQTIPAERGAYGAMTVGVTASVETSDPTLSAGLVAFDGSNDLVKAPAGITTPLDGEPLTMLGVFQLPNPGADQFPTYFANKEWSSGNVSAGVFMRLRTDQPLGRLYAGVGDGTAQVSANVLGFPYATQALGALIYNGTTLRAVICTDSETLLSGSADASAVGSGIAAAPVNVGRTPALAFGFTGSASTLLAGWGEALSDEDVLAVAGELLP